MLILADKEILFLKWFYNRLIYHYRLAESDNISLFFKNIIEKVSQPITINISDKDLEKIISKYYVDFFLDKDLTNQNCIGFTNEERINLKNITKNLAQDIINLNVPKETIIKDM
jgi:hypothetical protein